MFCDAVYNVLGNYNITWQAPAGWVQTSLTNKGSNVSFTPDANTAGVLTATIHLSCGYTETRTLSIVRGAEAPTFTATTVQACSPSTSISINPVCGAVDYTYSIVGNPGVTFSSNGQQLLRSSNTSVNISIAAGSSINTFKAIANFQGSNSSPESISSLIAGPQAPKSINGFFENGKKFDPNTQYTFSSTGSDWIVGGGTIISGQGTKIITVFTDGRPAGRKDLSFYMSVRENGLCGPSDYFSRSGWVVSGGIGGAQIIASPNPASSSINVSIEDSKTQTNESESISSKLIYKIRISDLSGNIKKVLEFKNAIKSTTISLSGIKAGTYVLSVFDNNQWNSMQIVIN